MMQVQKGLQEQEGKDKKVDDTEDEISFRKSLGKVPKMPYFDEERDFMDSYLGRFERFAESQKWKREHWAMYLSALLKGRALDVYSMMPSEQASNYDRLKDALLNVTSYKPMASRNVSVLLSQKPEKLRRSS